MLKVGPTFDYRSRPLLEIGLHSVQEWSCDLHLTTLLHGNYFGSISKLGVLF